MNHGEQFGAKKWSGPHGRLSRPTRSKEPQTASIHDLIFLSIALLYLLLFSGTS